MPENLNKNIFTRFLAALKMKLKSTRDDADTMSARDHLGFSRLALGRVRPHRRFSALSQRIIAINMIGLVILVGGVLYLNQFRAGLIDARVQSLVTQGQIIAASIAQSAVEREDTPVFDPGAFSRPKPAGCEGPSSLNPAPARAILQRLVVLTATRARLYDTRGCMILDTRDLSSTEVLSYELPPPGQDPIGDFIARIYDWIVGLIPAVDLPVYQEHPEAIGVAYEEVMLALNGNASSAVRVNDQGELIVSVALPVQPFRAVRGVLLLSTIGGDIDTIVRAERLAIVEVFLVALGVSVLLSFLLARTIAAPVRRLALAAEQVRIGISSRIEIPDFRNRRDEIGDLAAALRDMTAALYDRLDAIERFAADVAHDIKNPLTSLRSAVETLMWAKDPDARQRLVTIVQDDVRRLDRLITDISDASRLDAELVRDEVKPVSIASLLKTFADIAAELRKENAPHVELELAEDEKTGLFVRGFEGRLGQVFRNVIDNALSFSPPGGTVWLKAFKTDGRIRITVEDEGPGIPEENLETIFERFYTQRPEEAFGKNSGLGLSISRQIIEAHGGRIWAQNRRAENNTGNQILGARFIIELPAS